MHNRNATLVDGVLGRLVRVWGALPAVAGSEPASDNHSRLACAREIFCALPNTAPLVPGVVRGEPGAVGSYDRAVEAALAALREDTERRPALGKLAKTTVRALSQSSASGTRSVPGEASTRRETTLEVFEWLETHLRLYDRWSDLVALDLRTDGRPTRVLEVGAGRGGFAIALKERFGEAVDVVAADADPDLLLQGADDAWRRRVEVAFIEREEPSFDDVEVGAYDVIVMTPAAPRLEAGAKARWLASASRVAARAVWLFDGERTAYGAVGVGAIAAAQARSWAIGAEIASAMEQMPTEAELTLIAALAPAMTIGSVVAAGRCEPRSLYVHVTVPQADGGPATLVSASVSAEAAE